MAINTDVEIKGEWFDKWMTVEKLKTILSNTEINDNWEISCNRVGCLALMTEDGEFKGYIDFNEEEFNPASGGSN